VTFERSLTSVRSHVRCKVWRTAETFMTFFALVSTHFFVSGAQVFIQPWSGRESHRAFATVKFWFFHIHGASRTAAEISATVGMGKLRKAIKLIGENGWQTFLHCFWNDSINGNNCKHSSQLIQVKTMFVILILTRMEAFPNNMFNR